MDEESRSSDMFYDLNFDGNIGGKEFLDVELNKSVEDDFVEVKAPSLPDGGYGWIIVIVAFYSNFVVDGICYAFANFRPVLQRSFSGSSEASIAFVGSSIIGTYLIVGPIAGGLVNSFGPRKTVAIGGTISCLAFLASTVIGNVYILIVIYGIIGGIGFGFIYLPSIIVVCFYFDKKRSLATGIAVAGSGAGSVIMPFIIGQLQDRGFNTICIVQATFALSCTFAGMLYKPLSAEAEKRPTVGKGMVMTLEMEDLLEEDELPPASPLSPVIQQLRRNDGRERPKSYDFALLDENKNSGEARLSLVSDIADLSYKHMKSEIRDYARSFSASSTSRRFDSNVLSKPLVRSDNIFGTSGENLAVAKQEDFIKFRRNGSERDIDEKKKYSSGVKIVDTIVAEEKLNNVLKSYADLVKESALSILLVSNVFAMMGFYVPFVFPFDLAVASGISSDQAKNLVSLIGFSNTLGRLLFGWLSDKKWLTALTINNICLVFCGILTIFGPACNAYWSIVCFCMLFGVLGAAYICLTPIILTEWFGLDRLTNSFGLLVLGRSIGCFFGTPVAGAVKDATNSISWAFYASGSLLLLGGVSSCLIPIFAKPVKS